jgi:hypothetical protein
VTIDGFNIVGDDTIVSGIFVAEGTDNVSVTNNIIEGMERPGSGSGVDSFGILTAAESGDDNLVEGFVARNNTIQDIGNVELSAGEPTSAAGIALLDIAGDTPGDGAIIEGNDISGLAGQNATAGIAVQPLSRPAEDPGVELRDNTLSGGDVGVQIGDSGSLSIADNTFENQTIYVNDASGNVTLSTVLNNNTFSPPAAVFEDDNQIRLAVEQQDELIIERPTDIIRGEPFTITVTNQNDEPIEGATVIIEEGTDANRTKETNETGTVSLTAQDGDGQSLSVNVTAEELPAVSGFNRTAFGEGATGRLLEDAAVTLTNATIEENQNRVVSGENATVSVSLENTGNVSANETLTVSNETTPLVNETVEIDGNSVRNVSIENSISHLRTGCCYPEPLSQQRVCWVGQHPP